MEGFLIVILSISLVGKSLQMDLYKVYNLLALQPDLKVQFSYALEGEYLAISTSHTYATMPNSYEVVLVVQWDIHMQCGRHICSGACVNNM